MSPGTRIQLWKVGDRVRFAHQHPSGPVYTITKTLIDMNQPMVELKDMIGQFGAHIFIAADYPADSIVPPPPGGRR
jgi:hypothetical protein